MASRFTVTGRAERWDQGSQQAKTRQDEARLTKTALNPVLSRLGLVFIKPLDKRSSRLAFLALPHPSVELLRTPEPIVSESVKLLSTYLSKYNFSKLLGSG